MRAALVLLVVVASGCRDEGFDPGRSLRLAFEVTGLPDGGSAEYRVFVQDSVAIAHGRVANDETDTVHVSSSAALRVQWQDALLRVGEADYIYSPSGRTVLIGESNTDTTVTLAGSYALASGGFVLNAPGVPMQLWANWQAWNEDDSVVAAGRLRTGEMVRRGDLPPGSTRLRLDTIEVELDSVFHYFAPPQKFVHLSVTPSLDLIPIDAPYAVVSVALRLSPSGLPPGTYAPYTLSSASGRVGTGGSVPTDSVWTLDRFPPDSYIIEWAAVTVDEVTNLPTPATIAVTLDPRLEPYEFAALYAAVP